MNDSILGDRLECPQCGSEEEAIYIEVDGRIYIECSDCGYFEEAGIIKSLEENEDEDEDGRYVNSTAKKENLSSEEDHWLYYNLYLKNK